MQNACRIVVAVQFGAGDKGYFLIKRGEGTCGINTAVTTSIH